MAYNKFNLFTDDLVKGVYNFSSDVFKLILLNAAPIATNHVYADVSGNELSTANGYTAGGGAMTITLANVTGTETITGSDVTWTASGGSIGPFRYAALYDTTPTSPLKPLIAWWDYGTNLTITAGNQFVAQPNAGSPTGTVYTLA